jgi:hypothetical protein
VPQNSAVVVVVVVTIVVVIVIAVVIAAIVVLAIARDNGAILVESLYSKEKEVNNATTPPGLLAKLSHKLKTENFEVSPTAEKSLYLTRPPRLNSSIM